MPVPEPAKEPEPVSEESVTEHVIPDDFEMAPEDDGLGTSKLSNTQAIDSFNSLPESVRRMVMDADSEDTY